MYNDSTFLVNRVFCYLSSPPMLYDDFNATVVIGIPKTSSF